jgi:acetyltransferase-like isoleucine patch superfamily enzyme
VVDSIIGAGARLGADATATDQTIVGTSAVVAPGTTVAGGRIAGAARP